MQNCGNWLTMLLIFVCYFLLLLFFDLKVGCVCYGRWWSWFHRKLQAHFGPSLPPTKQSVRKIFAKFRKTPWATLKGPTRIVSVLMTTHYPNLPVASEPTTKHCSDSLCKSEFLVHPRDLLWPSLFFLILKIIINPFEYHSKIRRRQWVKTNFQI